MIGSAPYALAWLLIEHPGPWAIRALASAGIEPAVLRALSAAAAATSTRILLVRRPGRQSSSPTRTWTAIGSTRTISGSWQADADLLTAAVAVRSLAVGRPVVEAEAARDPIVLVCAHGTHDTCCAIRGRPVAAALAARWPEAVWECSHVGGDRFAPNVIVLPDAAYYGNLDADSAVEVVSNQLDGRLDIRWLRGLARFPPPAQAAIAEVHRLFGPMAASAVGAEDIEQLDAHTWRVPVHRGDRGWLATVIAQRREPAVLTCRAGSATPATAYQVVSLQPGPPSPAQRGQVAKPARGA